MNTNIITYLACICFLFIFGRIFIFPLKKILKLIFNSVLGGICICVINLIGSAFGFHIGLNFFTSIVIRLIRPTRSSLFNCCKVINWIERFESNCNSYLEMFVCVTARNQRVYMQGVKNPQIEMWGFYIIFLIYPSLSREISDVQW